MFNTWKIHASFVREISCEALATCSFPIFTIQMNPIYLAERFTCFLDECSKKKKTKEEEEKEIRKKQMFKKEFYGDK